MEAMTTKENYTENMPTVLQCCTAAGLHTNIEKLERKNNEIIKVNVQHLHTFTRGMTIAILLQ